MPAQSNDPNDADYVRPLGATPLSASPASPPSPSSSPPPSGPNSPELTPSKLVRETGTPFTDRRTPGTPELVNAEITGEEQMAPASSPASGPPSSPKTDAPDESVSPQEMARRRQITRQALGLEWSELTGLQAAAREYPRSHIRAIRNFRKVDGPGLDHLTTLFEQYDSMVRAGHVNRIRAREMLLAECIRVIFDAFSEEGPLS